MNITRQMIAAAHDVTMRHKIVLGHELLGEIYQAMKSASPASKPWASLTDVDRAEVQYEAHKKKLTPLEFMELHETKLREKNA